MWSVVSDSELVSHDVSSSKVDRFVDWGAGKIGTQISGSVRRSTVNVGKANVEVLFST